MAGESCTSSRNGVASSRRVQCSLDCSVTTINTTIMLESAFACLRWSLESRMHPLRTVPEEGGTTELRVGVSRTERPINLPYVFRSEIGYN